MDFLSLKEVAEVLPRLLDHVIMAKKYHEIALLSSRPGPGKKSECYILCLWEIPLFTLVQLENTNHSLAPPRNIL